MTPKEKKLIQLFYPNVQWKLGQEDCLDRAERCVLIAEDFAIGFGEWMASGVEFIDDTERGRIYYFKHHIYNTKELLEIYKETL